MKTWLHMAARGIVERYEQWDSEAMQQAMQSQNIEAGIAHLEQCVVSYLAWMQANHSLAEMRDEKEAACNESANEFNAVVAAEWRTT